MLYGLKELNILQFGKYDNNNNNDNKIEISRLELFCYYKVVIQEMKFFSVVIKILVMRCRIIVLEIVIYWLIYEKVFEGLFLVDKLIEKLLERFLI